MGWLPCHTPLGSPSKLPLSSPAKTQDLPHMKCLFSVWKSTELIEKVAGQAVCACADPSWDVLPCSRKFFNLLHDHS